MEFKRFGFCCDVLRLVCSNYANFPKRFKNDFPLDSLKVLYSDFCRYLCMDSVESVKYEDMYDVLVFLVKYYKSLRFINNIFGYNELYNLRFDIFDCFYNCDCDE